MKTSLPYSQRRSKSEYTQCTKSNSSLGTYNSRQKYPQRQGNASIYSTPQLFITKFSTPSFPHHDKHSSVQEIPREFDTAWKLMWFERDGSIPESITPETQAMNNSHSILRTTSAWFPDRNPQVSRRKFENSYRSWKRLLTATWRALFCSIDINECHPGSQLRIACNDRSQQLPQSILVAGEDKRVWRHSTLWLGRASPRMRNTFDNFIKPIRTMDYKPVYEKYAAGTTDDNCNLAALGDLSASNDGSLTKSIFNHIRNLSPEITNGNQWSLRSR